MTDPWDSPPYNPSYNSTSNTEYPSPGYLSAQTGGNPPNNISSDDAPPDYYAPSTYFI